MLKKMMLLAISATAMLAFAIPAVAQANVWLSEEPFGDPLPNNVEITATSTNLETATANGTLNCKKVTLHFKTTTNGFEHVLLDPVGGATTEGCSVTQNGFPVTVTGGAVTSNLTIDTWGNGSTTATFNSAVYSPLDPTHSKPLLSCHYSGGLNVASVEEGGSEITVAGTVGGACGNGNMTGSFKLETSNGTPVFINYVAT